MNNEFIKDAGKVIKNYDIQQEITPGTVGRRYEPEGGLKKYRDKIHRESKFADEHKNLPFKFSKPSKNKRSKIVKCCNCEYITRVNIDTVGMICSNCGKFSSVEEV